MRISDYLEHITIYVALERTTCFILKQLSVLLLDILMTF